MSELRISMPWEMAGLEPKTPVLLAFSGGADSRALLELLRKGAARNGFEITLAHVNHGIRGAEADRDQRFCESVAAACGLRIFCAVRDVPALAKEHRTTLEEEARRVRYEFFSEIMEREGIPLLATAHQADDQLETLLFRLCRGTGLRGLCGIPAVRRFGSGFALRPMLEIPGREIRAYCAENGLEYITDSTNADTSYARNLIRAEVVPVLEKLYGEPQKRAAALAQELCETEDYFRGQEESFLRQNGEEKLSCKRLAPLHPVLQKRILCAWLAQYGVVPERVHLEALVRLLDAENGAKCSVPGDRVVVKRKDALEVVCKESDAPSDYRMELTAGEIAAPGAGWNISVVRVAGGETGNEPERGKNAMIFPRAAADGAFFRPMREGDKIFTRGAHHVVRRLYREAGIPPEERICRPMLCKENEILWIPGVALRDGIEQKAKTGDFLLLFQPAKKERT